MIPKISLENLMLSKIVCGCNPFVGITHRWNLIDIFLHLKRFKEPESVASFMIYLLQEHGINCCLSSPRDKIFEAIKITKYETGENYYWICTPSRRRTVKNLPKEVYKQIDWCAEKEVSVCMPHRDYTDNALDKNKLVIGERHPSLPSYPEVSSYIRDLGMIPGLSTHYHETIIAVEKNNYDAPLVIQPFNMIGYHFEKGTRLWNYWGDATRTPTRHSSAIPEHLIKIIQNTKLQILNIKPMAAGRIRPRDALTFCLRNIKKNDFLAAGFSKFQHCVENGKIFEEILNPLKVRITKELKHK